MSVLLFTPVHQDAAVFAEVLKSHRALRGVDHRLYVDDNASPETSELLRAEAGPDVTVAGNNDSQGRLEYAGHRWTGDLVSHIAAIRNAGIRHALTGGHDHFFNVDADVILHPATVEQLVSLGAPIATEVYWSKWPRPGGDVTQWMPQVWDFHPYGFDCADSLLRLKHAGTWEMRGGGACTLVSREVLLKSVDYSLLPSVRMFGEDRAFCIKAEVCGFQRLADTNYPPFHVYRPEQLAEALAWAADGCHPGYFRKFWLTDQWERDVRGMLGRGE